jgi:hypothetical protein
MIPKTIYFTFGFSPDFGGKPFNLVHGLAIKSAKVVNDCDVVLYYQYEPEDNVWWEEASDYCIHEKCQAPTEVFGHPLPNVSYRSDIFRLNLLNERGGVYFDIDTISIKPIDPLLSSSFVMGQEWAKGRQIGLCNAVMLAEKNSQFGRIWMEEYDKNYNGDWGVMSVVRPWELSKTKCSDISILPPTAFFKYSWSEEDLIKVHEGVSDISDAYLLHLWEQACYEKYIKPVTVDDIRNRNSTYNLLARRFL